MAKYSLAAQSKVKKVMGEFGKGKLHAGSKKGPIVKSQKQAVAIGLSQARERGMKVPPAKGLSKRVGVGRKSTAEQRLRGKWF